jgi:hypothetical protein
VRPTREQAERLRALIVQLEQRDPDTDWRGRARQLAGVPAELLTRTVADTLIRELERLAADDDPQRGAD